MIHMVQKLLIKQIILYLIAADLFLIVLYSFYGYSNYRLYSMNKY